jgi:hypothetical protein
MQDGFMLSSRPSAFLLFFVCAFEFFGVFGVFGGYKVLPFSPDYRIPR